MGTTGLVVVVNGKVVLEYGDVVQRGYLAAGRYSVLAMLYGKPVADGTIDLGMTLGEIGIDDREGLLPVEKRATVEQLLTYRFGVYHPTQFGDGPRGTPPRGSVEPGRYFLYRAWGPLTACGVYELLTGRDFYQAVQEDLGEPLSLQDFRWKRHAKSRDRSPSWFPVYNLFISTRDIARLGQLMLRSGEWRGEQLIPRAWVERITSVVTPREELKPEEYRSRGMGFGYQWWAWDEPDRDSPYFRAFTYTGSYGQYLTVLPALGMVVAHQVYAGWFGAPKKSVTWQAYRGFLERLLAARVD